MDPEPSPDAEARDWSALQWWAGAALGAVVAWQAGASLLLLVGPDAWEAVALHPVAGATMASLFVAGSAVHVAAGAKARRRRTTDVAVALGRRAAGWVLLVWLGFHTWFTSGRVVFGLTGAHEVHGDLIRLHSTTGALGVPWAACGALLGAVAGGWHLAAGLGTAPGGSLRGGAARKAAVVAAVLASALTALAVVHLATGQRWLPAAW